MESDLFVFPKEGAEVKHDLGEEEDPTPPDEDKIEELFRGGENEVPERDNFPPPVIGFAVKLERGRCAIRGGGVEKLGPVRVVTTYSLALRWLLWVVDLVMGTWRGG